MHNLADLRIQLNFDRPMIHTSHKQIISRNVEKRKNMYTMYASYFFFFFFF